jgi:hypothetical protein
MELNSGLLNESGLNDAGGAGGPTPPGLLVVQEHEATWSLRPQIQAWHEARWEPLGRIAQWHEALFGAVITGYHEARWGFSIDTAYHVAPYSLRPLISQQHEARFDLDLLQEVGQQHEARWSSPVSQQHEARWSMRAKVERHHEATWSQTNPVAQQHEVLFDLMLRNPVRRGHLAPYSMLSAVVQNITGAPYVIKDGRQVGISGADFSCAEDGYAWTCNVDLTAIPDYQDFQRDDLFAVVLFGDSYIFMMDSKGISRPGPAQATMSVNGISPAAWLDRPRATLISKTWDTPTMAQDIALEVCGTVNLDWQIYDWLIPAGRLAVNDATPLSVLQQLATAAGAVVEADTQGGIVVRPEFPVSVPDWESATPDHVFSDLPDNISMREGVAAADHFNRFYLADMAAGSTNDRIEFEADEGNAYAGTLRVYPGTWRTNLVVTSTRDGVILVPAGVQYREEEETIEITQGTGQTAFPIDAILSTEWLDRDLGAVSFVNYTNVVTVPGTGDRYSLLKIRYRTKALVYRAEYAENGEAQFLVEEV